MTERWTDDPQVQDDPALGSFLRDLSTHADDTVDPATRAATLEAMLEVAAQAPSSSHHPAPWARRARRVLGLTSVKLALAAGVAAATTTGGLAATGSLPAPIQSFAHDVGRHIGIGFPDAPGQQKKLTDEADTGRDFAPGQLRKSEPGTTGRDHAPGQQRDDGTSGRSDKGPARDELRHDDADQPGHVTPDQEPPADVVPEQETPGDAAPETPGEPAQAPEQPEPPPPPDEDQPAGAATETTPDPATAPGRPDAPADDQPDSRQGPPDDASTQGTGR